MIKQLVGKQSTIRQVAAVEDDPQRRKPDISRAKKYLGWEPKVCISFLFKIAISVVCLNFL
jgi:UDP-glucuronate decarboxylase